VSSREFIRGSVAKILNSRELIINRGKEHGVALDMVFAVLDPKAENVKDPETGEMLGSIYRPKVKVKVVRVDDRLSLARTYRKSVINVGGRGDAVLGFARMFEPPRLVTRYETFKTDEADWEDITEAQSIVKVGDPVEEVPPAQREDEEEEEEVDLTKSSD
jgi:hypothetical protein